MYLQLLEAAALLWLDARDHVLCGLSMDSNEWPEEMPIDKLTECRQLMESMKDYAESAVEEKETRPLIWGVLNRIARKCQYTTSVNWSLYPKHHFNSESA